MWMMDGDREDAHWMMQRCDYLHCIETLSSTPTHIAFAQHIRLGLPSDRQNDGVLRPAGCM